MNVQWKTEGKISASYKLSWNQIDMSDLEITGTEILETCRQKFTPSTQLQNRSFHAKDKRPTLKCTKIKTHV